MAQVIIEGWLLGISTGPYCLGACAPFMVPYLFAEGRGAWRLVGEFLAGRFLAYALFGALTGWLGERLPLTPRFAAAALGVTAGLMLLYAIGRSMPTWRFCAAWALPQRLKRLPLVMGFLIGLNVCPPFLVAIARLLQLGQVAAGVVFFAGFFAGTSLYVLPLVALAPFARLERLQRIGTLSAILVSLWYLGTALAAL